MLCVRLEESIFMLKTILLLGLAVSTAFAESPLVGTWGGSLDNFKDRLNLAISIRERDGKFSGTVAAYENNQTFAVEVLAFADGRIRLNTPAQSGLYIGKVVGDEMTGTWTQGTLSFPLNFSRAGEPKPITLTPAERAFAVSYFERTSKEFFDSIQGLTTAQWNYKPANGGWSVAQCAEHIVLSEGVIFEEMKKILEGPVNPDVARGGQDRDQRVIAAELDRSKKATAPETLKPSGKFPTPDRVMAAFTEKRNRNIGFIKTTAEDLRLHVQKNPVFFEVDAYEYLLIIAAHSARHTAQLQAVKAEPGFPK